MTFAQSLVDLEAKCLVQLSKASRENDNHQIALNSVIRAQKLLARAEFDVSHEYARVLWLAEEPRPAVQHLRGLMEAVGSGIYKKETSDPTIKASLYALLVCLVSHTGHIP